MVQGEMYSLLCLNRSCCFLQLCNICQATARCAMHGAQNDNNAQNVLTLWHKSYNPLTRLLRNVRYYRNYKRNPKIFLDFVVGFILDYSYIYI